MKYYSSLMKRESLLLATTWMKLENVILSEISQAQANTTHSHLYVESKTIKLTKVNRRMVATGSGGWGEGQDDGQRVSLRQEK
jgi:hypothetical protein